MPDMLCTRTMEQGQLPTGHCLTKVHCWPCSGWTEILSVHSHDLQLQYGGVVWKAYRTDWNLAQPHTHMLGACCTHQDLV